MATRKIGLVGGMGPESTLIYYKEINRMICDSCGGGRFPEIAIESVDMYKFFEYLKAGELEQLEQYMWEKIENLLGCKCEIIALACNTVHVVYHSLAKRLKAKSDVPLISLPKITCDEAKRRCFRKVGLLGTLYTMKMDFFKQDFISAGVEVITPDDDNKAKISSIIIDELEMGIVKPSSQAALIEQIQEMQKMHGIEAVILGCTELPLAFNEDNCPLPYLDTMQLHIEKLVEISLE